MRASLSRQYPLDDLTHLRLDDPNATSCRDFCDATPREHRRFRAFQLAHQLGYNWAAAAFRIGVRRVEFPGMATAEAFAAIANEHHLPCYAEPSADGLMWACTCKEK